MNYHHLIDTICEYGTVVGLTTLAIESAYRNLGGNPEHTQYLFYTGLAAFITSGAAHFTQDILIKNTIKAINQDEKKREKIPSPLEEMQRNPDILEFPTARRS